MAKAEKKSAAEGSKKSKYPWTDEDLAFFQDLILEKRREALEEIECLRSQVVSDNKADLDEDSEYAYHMADSASVATDREYIYRMIDRQERLIGYLDRALERIQNRTYGICRVTGMPINRERLEVIPHTELSVEGKLIEKQRESSPRAEDDADLIGL
ncbi:molecular chaperone DnaK [bacterium]|nr:molecular chaperone DnaK [bacterium]